jgi:phosphatidate phosphatase APP1
MSVGLLAVTIIFESNDAKSMSRLKKHFTTLLSKFDDQVDSWMLELRSRIGSDSPLQIVTFKSYGTKHRIYVKGRVLEDKKIAQSTAKDSIWNNLLSMYKRFDSDEVPGATLLLTFNEKDHQVITDHEGYFTIEFAEDLQTVEAVMWFQIDVRLISAPYSFSPGITSIAHVLIPPADAEYGIISDLDDTVIKTGATDLLAMSRNTLFHNAHSRLPFAGVAEFYKALQLGRNGKRNNPFFYVSSSPWNLYDLLDDFLEVNNIPDGPLLLRDYGVDQHTAEANHMNHKFKEISNILSTYPLLNFVLVGDSGQEDPKIYHEVVSRFPGRILAIYIRDVQLAERERIAIEFSKQLVDDKVEMVIVDNTVEAAEHAAKNGLIFSDAIPEIVIDKEKDKGQIPGKEKI